MINTKKKAKKFFYAICVKCGYGKSKKGKDCWKRTSNKGVGRCPSCGGYNRFKAMKDRRFRTPKVVSKLRKYKPKRKKTRARKRLSTAVAVETVAN